MKKLISILVVLALCFGLMPMGVLAGEGANYPNNKFYVEYDDCDGAGIDLPGVSPVRLQRIDWGAQEKNRYDFVTNKKIEFVLFSPAPDGKSLGKPYRVEVIKMADWRKIDVLSAVSDNGHYKVEYTPETGDCFMLRVFWTEQQYNYDQCHADSGQIMVEFRAEGSGRVDYNDKDGRIVAHADYNGMSRVVLKNGTTSFALTAVPAGNEHLESINVEQDNTQNVNLKSDNRYNVQTSAFTLNFSGSAYNDNNGTKFVNVAFRFSGGNPGGDNGGNNGGDNGGDNGGGQGGPSGPTFTKQDVANAISNYLFAYYISTSDTSVAVAAIKTLMAKELADRKIGVDATLAGVLQKNADEMKEMIQLTPGTEPNVLSDSDVNTFYDYKITIESAVGSTPAIEATGKVYVLPSNRDIVIKSFNGNGEVTYSKATLSNEENATNSVYANFVFPEGDGWRGEPKFEVYGNGAWLNTIYNEDRGICAYHITQEHSGGITTFPAGARLLVSNNKQTVTLSYSENAAAWDFANANAYGVGTADNHATANVFYGADNITLTATDYANVTGEKTISKIEVLNLPEGAVDVSGTTLTFHTDYDYVQLKITYNDSPEGYLDLHRVGLVIDSMNVEGAPDAEHYGDHLSEELAAHDAIWGPGAKTFNIWHGTDQSVRYKADDTAQKVVTASFYYGDATGINYEGETSPDSWSTFDNGVSKKYASLDHVNLFVTITYENGTKEIKLLPMNEAITRGEKAVATANGGFRKDLRTTPGYAGQGSCHFYDDFVLWSGSNSDFTAIKSISAIVYTPGANDDTFGGVKVGSGTGVQWTNSAK